MKRIHRISGLTVAIFISFHLFNHLYSLFGVVEHIEMMNKFRVVYRNAFIETILLTAIFIQIITGIKLFIKKKKSAQGYWDNLQIWSGLYLAFFFVFHLGAVFMGRLVFNLNTNIYFGTAGLNAFPFNLFFVPYYGLAIISFFGHISVVHAKKMKRDIFGIQPHKQASIILGIGIILALAILYGLTNGFAGIEIPSEYNIMLGK